MLCVGLAGLSVSHMQINAAIKELVTAVKEQGAEAKEQRQLLGLILEQLPIRSRASSAGKSPPQGGQALHSTASSLSAISNSSSAHSVK